MDHVDVAGLTWPDVLPAARGDRADNRQGGQSRRATTPTAPITRALIIAELAVLSTEQFVAARDVRHVDAATKSRILNIASWRAS